MPTFTDLIQLYTGGLSQGCKTRKRNEMHNNCKGRNKLSLLAGDMILYMENPKESNNKLLQITTV